MDNCEVKKPTRFVKFMILYAMIFLIVGAVGLSLFWNYIDAYENSRTKSTLDAYIKELTPAYVYDRSGELVAGIDHRLQSEEACKAVITEFLSGDITYARKSSECTDTHMVYMLRSGGKTIGKVELEPHGKKRYGFTSWAISQDSFDLSFLLGNTATITVDRTMQVYANNVLLDESYVTEAKLPYRILKDFYDEMDLPYKMTYTAGPILGQIHLHAVDANGQAVEITQESDLDRYLNNCTEAVHKELDTFIRNFIDRYTRYLTSRIDTRMYNLQQLTPLLVPGSDLEVRINQAYDGLQYGQSKSDTITDFVSNHIIDLGEGKFLCDVTYEVDSLGRDGKLHHSVNNAQILLIRTDSGLKAERLLSY